MLSLLLDPYHQEHLVRWREFAELRLPVRERRLRCHYQVWPLVAFELLKILEPCYGLNSLSEAHFVREDPVKVVHVDRHQPFKPIDLVGHQIRLEPLRYGYRLLNRVDKPQICLPAVNIQGASADCGQRLFRGCLDAQSLGRAAHNVPHAAIHLLQNLRHSFHPYFLDREALEWCSALPHQPFFLRLGGFRLPSRQFPGLLGLLLPLLLLLRLDVCAIGQGSSGFAQHVIARTVLCRHLE
mmetsp:Transcript_36935/g.102594  ORF Transcript_36935/g.102594 Transcript_36935/m.102594 type:complete len:240 (-) Transcript_36935:793-1512(-)